MVESACDPEGGSGTTSSESVCASVLFNKRFDVGDSRVDEEDSGKFVISRSSIP